MEQDFHDELEIILAKSSGTCFGVEAAIEIAENSAKPILGPIVHNPKIVDDLSKKGIAILERYEDIDNLQKGSVDEVVITAHGYPKQLKEDLKSRGIKYRDATCPVLLKWVYKKIETFEAQGYHIILIGNPNHAEIIASRSYGDNISVVYSESEVDLLEEGLEPVIAICQTTITAERFESLVNYIRETKYPELKAVDTRCKPVKNQQTAVENLAQWVDAMVIVGGYNSSNTTNLAKLAQRYLPNTTYHIDSPERIDRQWLRGVKHLGIGAGTSTPKSQIIEVQEKIRDLFPGEILLQNES